MIIGVMSDTHEDRNNAIPKIIKEFKKRNVDFIIHCGDILSKHLSVELFEGIPVICALIKEQLEKPKFKETPLNWIFTTPDERVLTHQDIRMYVGHKRSFDFLVGTEEKLMQFLYEIRKNNDGLRWVFCGHTHHQLLLQTQLTNLINPGAVEDSLDGYEFVIVNTKNNEIVFSRIMKTKPEIATFSIGVISDSLKISKMDPSFWQLLAEEFKKRDVKNIIHCGNLALEDIGRPELNDFTIFFNLRPDQKIKESLPVNWQLIHEEEPIVKINDYNFYVKLDLGALLLDQSEVDMHKFCLSLRRKYHDIDFILCGFTNNALLVGEEQSKILNPGDVFKNRGFVVICLPRSEITFGHVPLI